MTNDLISRQYVIGLIRSMYPSPPILPSNRRKWAEKYEQFIRAEREISNLPSAEPETFEWCHDCKEYDQEQHCCHRWSQQIRKTIEELEANYPQEAKEELQYWKERAAQLDKAYELGWKDGRESFREDAIDAINKRIQFLKDDPVFKRKHGDIDLYGIKPIIRSLPSVQPEDVIRIKGIRKHVPNIDLEEVEEE